MSARIIVQAWKSNIAEGFENEASNPLAFVFDDLCVCVYVRWIIVCFVVRSSIFTGPQVVEGHEQLKQVSLEV